MKEVNLASIISAYDTFGKEELFNNYLNRGKQITSKN